MAKRIKYFTMAIVAIIVLASIALPIVRSDAIMAEQAADPATLKWIRNDTPGSITDKHDVVSPFEVNRIAIGADGETFYAVDIPNARSADGTRALYKSEDGGISWSDRIGVNLHAKMSVAEKANFRVWDIAIAKDDVNYIAVVTNSAATAHPRNVWISIDGGTDWNSTNCTVSADISCIDISPDAGGRFLVIGTRNGAGGGDVLVFSTSRYSGWVTQVLNGDALSLKYSPSYTSDETYVVVYATCAGTYINGGVYDPVTNKTNWNQVYGGTPPEVTTGGSGTSPKAGQIIGADLEIPSDYSGQAISKRRCYVSTDALVANAGIYRFDDTIPNWILHATDTKRISSIAYYGNYSTGKLLAGEVLGQPCTASVMTWFTDAAMTCPDTCWYSAKKPPTGAAGSDTCTVSGYGNARVAWSPDAEIVYCGTASSASLVSGIGWATPFLTGEDFDESAFSISRNDGQTWNQVSLIDTKISRFYDLAPAPDDSVMYLASVNEQANCSGFDSVWRSRGRSPALIWERILCKPSTQQSCAGGQTNQVILSLPGDKQDGSVVFWAARGTQSLYWSVNSGDYWEAITPAFAIQDMTAEDSSILYVLNTGGKVQKLVFNGSGWRGSTPVSSGLQSGYSIATAYTGMTPDNDKGTVIVGGTGASGLDVVYSLDGAATFIEIGRNLPTTGNTLVCAVSGFRSDGTILAINEGGMYAWSIYGESDQQWQAWWGGPPWASSVTSIAISRNYSCYFTEPSLWGGPATPYIRYSSAYAGLDAAVDLGTGAAPTRRTKLAGGLFFDDPVQMWLIDQRDYAPPAGGLWRYSDTLAWAGPSPIQPSNRVAVEFDPVSGKANEINMMWRFKSLSKGYRIQIAKDRNFNLMFVDIGSVWGGPFYTPPDYDNPALIIPPGGGTVKDRNGSTWIVPALEAGHPYYWRVRVRDVLPGDAISSPWSYGETFIVTQGLRVTSPYYGPHLLYPENGCGCACDASVNFSWSPYKTTEKYKFELSEHPDMSMPLVSTEVNTTAYAYKGVTKCNSAYYWRVMATQPAPSEWSAVFSYKSAAAVELAARQEKLPVTKTPLFVWVMIAISLLFIVAMGIMIVTITRASRGG